MHPTNFRISDYDSCMPTRDRLFKSLLKRWNHYSGIPFSEELVIAIYPSEMNLHSEIATDSRSKFIGSVGSITFNILDDVPLCLSLRRAGFRLRSTLCYSHPWPERSRRPTRQPSTNPHPWPITPTRGLSAAEGQFPMTSLYITQPDAQLSKQYEAFKVALKQDVHVYYEIVRPKQDF